MHPAYSVILFTTASGAGYGLLFWLCVLGVRGVVPIDPWFGFFGLGIALTLITAGLLSSTFHLGRPERAWRAFSQWRSSWLSREAVAAVATYVPAGLVGIGWFFLGDLSGFWGLMAILTAIGALITVGCTGMIYASLRTIRQWHHPLVTPVYLLLALMSGAVLMLTFGIIAGYELASFGWLTIGLVVAAAVMKTLYWLQIRADHGVYTAEQATGLGHLGHVKPLEPAHTQANFVMREMGYSVARKHADRVRQFCYVAGFGIPVLALLASLLATGVIAGLAAIIGVITMAAGLLAERWLFFAEAQHVVTLYYGAERA